MDTKSIDIFIDTLNTYRAAIASSIEDDYKENKPFNVEAIARSKAKLNELFRVYTSIQNTVDQMKVTYDALDADYNKKIDVLQSYITNIRNNTADVTTTNTHANTHNTHTTTHTTQTNTTKTDIKIKSKGESKSEANRFDVLKETAESTNSKNAKTWSEVARVEDDVFINVPQRKQRKNKSSESADDTVVAVGNVLAIAELPKLMVANAPNAVKTSVASAVKQYNTTRQYITQNFYLDVVIVQSFNEVLQNGQLFYVSKNDHFAIKFNGALLHGNIGEIYVNNERHPSYVRSCKFREKCTNESCEYYHDPLYCSDSKDVRNYMPESFKYDNSGTITPLNRLNMRRIGSKPSLEIDVITVDDDSKELYMNQVMHDILVLLILNKIKK